MSTRYGSQSKGSITLSGCVMPEGFNVASKALRLGHDWQPQI